MKVTVTPLRALQDTQEVGGDGEHMLAKVVCRVDAGGKTYPEVTIELKQVVGSDFAEFLVEPSRPQGYDGPWNSVAFVDGIEAYYRKLIGMTTGRPDAAIHFEPGAKRLQLRNTGFHIPGEPFTFEAEDGPDGRGVW